MDAIVQDRDIVRGLLGSEGRSDVGDGLLDHSSHGCALGEWWLWERSCLLAGADAVTQEGAAV